MIQLKDICDIYDCPHTTAKDEGKGYPLVRTPNVGKGRLILDGIHRVSEDVYNSRNARAIPEEGDLILAREAPVGNVSIIMDGQRVCLGQRVVLIKPKRELVDPHFLTYYLLSAEVQHRLKNHANGAVVAHLNVSDIRNLWVTLPELDEQVAIGKILRSIDDKIEINRQINDNLEQQAQALYKSWFIDFEPFKEEEFVDTEVGMVPRGWRIGNLLDVAELYDSKRKPLSGMQRSTMKKIYPYYGATSIMDYVDNYIFDGTYLLMGEDGSVITDEGYPFLQYVSGKFWPNNHAHVMQGKNGFTTEMLHCLLLKKNISEIVTGAVQAKVSQGNMKKISLAIAPNEILSAFSQVLDGIYAKIRAIYSENQQLETMRDTLLPKLMSGELNLNEIDC